MGESQKFRSVCVVSQVLLALAPLGLLPLQHLSTSSLTAAGRCTS